MSEEDGCKEKSAVRGRFTVPSLADIKKASKINTQSKPSLFKKAKDVSSIINLKAETDSQSSNSLVSNPISLEDKLRVTRSTFPAVESVDHNAADTNSSKNSLEDIFNDVTSSSTLGCHKKDPSDEPRVNDVPCTTLGKYAVGQTDKDHHGQSSSTVFSVASVASNVTKSNESVGSKQGPQVSMETKDQSGMSGAVIRKTRNPRSIIVNIVQVCYKLVSYCPSSPPATVVCFY